MYYLALINPLVPSVHQKVIHTQTDLQLKGKFLDKTRSRTNAPDELRKVLICLL